MREENLALIIYYLADRFGNDGVENGDMVNLLRLLKEEELITNDDDLSRETRRLSDGIQNILSHRRLIEGVPERHSGGRSGNRGWRRITDAGRAAAQTLLS